MNILTDQQLLESYEKARELNLDQAFIQLIQNELIRRQEKGLLIN